jgi:hypothetical protein
MVHWPFYNESWVRRGQVMMMMDFDVIDGWLAAGGIRKNESGQDWSAISSLSRIICSTFRVHACIFPSTFRQTEGVVVKAHAKSIIPSIPVQYH